MTLKPDSMESMSIKRGRRRRRRSRSSTEASEAVSLRASLDRWCEWGILGLVLAVLIYAPLALGAVRVSDFAVIELLMCGILILWGVRVWAAPDASLHWPPICWGVTAFVGYAIVRYLHAPVELSARHEMLQALVCGFMFLAVVNHVNRPETIRVLVVALIGLAAVLAGYAFFQYVTHSERVWWYPNPNYAERGSGTFINPNHLAGFLEMILPLALACAIVGRKGYTARIVLGYFGVVILAGIGVTVSRGAYVAAALALIAFFGFLVFKTHSRWPAAGLLVVVAALAGFFISRSTMFHLRIQRTFQEGELADVRPLIWKPAVAMWMDHKWLGLGPAQFEHEFRAYRPPTLHAQVRPEFVHNDYLNTLVDYGVVGLGLIGLCLALFWWGVFKVWPFLRRPSKSGSTWKTDKSAYVLGGAIGILAILIHSVTDFNMHVPANALLASAIMAVVAAHWRYATTKFSLPAGVIAKLLVTIVALGGVLFIGGQARVVLEQHHWLKASEASGDPEERLALLKRAFESEPQDFALAYRIGELYRLASWQGGAGYKQLALEAVDWFKKGIQLNPLDAFNPLRLGMCLDWIGQPADASPWFRKALALDPNGYYTLAMVGWHDYQAGDYAEAVEALERSMKIEYNYTAYYYRSLALSKIGQRKKEMNQAHK